MKQKRYRFWLIALGSAVLVAVLVSLWHINDSARITTLPTDALLNTPANRWTRLPATPPAWPRQAHAGAAWDSRRGLLLVFGSDTHGENNDNALHVFDPGQLRWLDLSPATSPRSLRADAMGRAVAGPDDTPTPWPMHTFDLIEYDPVTNALWVLAFPLHHPKYKSLPYRTQSPIWVYHFDSGRWTAFGQEEGDLPKVFAGSLVYDRRRDTLIAFGSSALWELGPHRDHWKRVRLSEEETLGIHHSAVAASDRGTIFIFGHSREAVRDGPFLIRVYHPGRVAHEPGRWEVREPSGQCPAPWQHYPVAYDSRLRLFLMVVPLRQASHHDRRGHAIYSATPEVRTYVYDPDANRCTPLADAMIPPGRVSAMNYQMVWDNLDNVFLLVAEDERQRPEVWALRLACLGPVSQDWAACSAYP